MLQFTVNLPPTNPYIRYVAGDASTGECGYIAEVLQEAQRLFSVDGRSALMQQSSEEVMWMGNSTFTQEEVAYLNSLPAVSRVTNGRITYTEQFKRECARRYLHGESPAKLFREAGLDPALIGYKRVERCVARWKIRYADESDRDESSPELPQQIIAPVSKCETERSAGHVNQTMTDVLLRQQSRHIDELEQQADMMRRHIAQLETVLRRRSAATEAHVAAEFASMITQSDPREDFVSGGVPMFLSTL